MPRIILALAAVSIGAAACTRAVEYRMDEPIRMGPFTFSVISATKGKQWQSADGPVREIEIRIRVQQDRSAPFSDTFTSYLLGRLDIVDAAGNRIGSDARPISPTYSSGRYRSEVYSCLFRYSRSLDGIRDFDAVGTDPKDFRLIVSHPSPGAGEPAVAAVQLQ